MIYIFYQGSTMTLANALRIQTKPQHLQLSPKLNIVPNLQSPPTPCTPVIYNQTPQKSLSHLPPSTTLSPVTPSLTSPKSTLSLQYEVSQTQCSSNPSQWNHYSKSNQHNPPAYTQRRGDSLRFYSYYKRHCGEQGLRAGR